MTIIASASVEHIHHNAVYPELLVDSFYHNSLIDRLILKIHIKIIHFFHMDKWLKSKDIIHVKGMLRQLQSTVMKKFCPVDHRVHQKIFSLMHMYLIPAKNLIYRKTVPVLHNSFSFRPLFLIDKIADQKIHGF